MFYTTNDSGEYFEVGDYVVIPGDQEILKIERFFKYKDTTFAVFDGVEAVNINKIVPYE